MNISCKSKKVDSKISPKKDSEEFITKSTKRKKKFFQHNTDLCPKGIVRTVDSGTSEIVKSPKIEYSETGREMQSGLLEKN